MKLNWPLMNNNIIREDLDTVIDFLKSDPILTNSQQVLEFEKEWSDWLGVKYSVFVNSGTAANYLSMAAIRHTYGEGEIIVPSLTWVSDIASVLYTGHTPIFVDINPINLAMDEDEVISKITDKTRAVFLTHILGFNGLSDKLLNTLKERNIPLIEDVCESHGASYKGQKLGTFGLMSNFSFYYAHHMSTIEGGMVCTDDENVYQMVRMIRSHGMVRESTSNTLKQEYVDKYPSLNPDFIFAYPGFNFRSTEINAVMGRSQLKRLDDNNLKRVSNYKLFLDNLDSTKYRTDFDCEGSVNYAFVLVLKEADEILSKKVMEALSRAGVEFRRGTSGGGNQLRQPYLQGIVPTDEYKRYPKVDHIHFYGYYIGNYPDLEQDKILKLCEILNSVE